MSDSESFELPVDPPPKIPPIISFNQLTELDKAHPLYSLYDISASLEPIFKSSAQLATKTGLMDLVHQLERFRKTLGEVWTEEPQVTLSEATELDTYVLRVMEDLVQRLTDPGGDQNSSGPPRATEDISYLTPDLSPVPSPVPSPEP
ncbi:hypothetical protein TREMEDRAFT_65870 [Tremella mesenterica DSM 1558]|uniref:uncharacterized protein n=1 Tax=Tremella mesenterica (strain ATCC 24925 / CBS 8224 / DSM 1558 / NBRC 9311 / NRRL Y-6157 / RJB 2259-6 / UBC 559-6) TaxID=578456 RepID=UPI00032C52C4|nr:uncharacterized protein TREMEDRAFT_65870 [Tremella mesenterica DSM 1558]EIW66027.1 hypothetical protein TREMEDRAFT_65870 [Tremella mesenterica DSM 1558]